MNQINIPYKLRILNTNDEVFEELLSFIQELGCSKVALMTSKTPNHLITNDLEMKLFHKVEKLKTFQIVNPSVSYVNQLSLDNFDLVVGVGGGKVIDIAKYTAHVNKLSCVSIPTSISNDGICSPVAVLKEKQNKYKSLGATIPAALFVPLHIIQKANEESIISGIGDLLSNLSAIEDWKLAHAEKNEEIDDYAVMISKHAALTVFSEAKSYILMHKKKEQFIQDNLKTIVEALALSGIAMEIAGTSRPASGAEHLLSHSIDELYGITKPHGIQVAFGMYITMFIRYELGLISKHAFHEYRAVFRYLGLPTNLVLLGLTKEQLTNAILHAPQTREDRYTVLNKIKLDKNTVDSILDKLFDVKISVA